MVLAARPAPVPAAGTERLAPGVHPLGLRPRRDALVHVPAAHDPAVPAPVVVLLHGAGSDAVSGLAPLLAHADAAGLVLVAPSSLGSTWDVLFGTGGPDAGVLDAALGHVFDRVAADPARIAVGGFSDGATAAIGFGRANAELFAGGVVALSPGFVPDGPAGPDPRPVFVSHGRADAVLPIERCGRIVARRLRAEGHRVELHEFDGGHTVPDEIARAAVAFLTG